MPEMTPRVLQRTFFKKIMKGYHKGISEEVLKKIQKERTAKIIALDIYKENTEKYCYKLFPKKLP